QHAVRGGHVYLFGAAIVDHLGGSADGAGGADHVVEHQGNLVFDWSADDIFLPGVLGIGTALIDDGQVAAQPLGASQGPLDAPLVGADDHHVLGIDVHFQKVLVEHRRGVEVIDRHVEEALNLGRVQIHGQHPICARAGNDVGHELGS